MNKQELIKKYEASLKDHSPFGQIVSYTLIVSHFLDELKRLDEPQKVTVPQFVADWYEENKDDFETKLFNVIDLLFRDLEDDELSEFEEWIVDKHTAPFQTLVNMHQFGYTVEKEKRYFVRIKHAGISNSLLKRTPKGEWWFGINFDDESQAHTRKELEEAGFGEVFDSPLFEVEEITE